MQKIQSWRPAGCETLFLPALPNCSPLNYKAMKTPINAKSVPTIASPADARVGGLRPHAAKTFEHRHERRKIREQLRRLDWALNGEEEIFA